MGRRNYLVEGVSGAGESAVCAELRRRGQHAVDGDRELAYQGDPESGAPVEGVTGVRVHDHHLWRIDRVEAIVRDDREAATFLCGGSRNRDRFVDRFDAVFLLTIDRDTLRARLDRRGGDEWAGAGRTAERALVERLHASGAEEPAGAIRIDATAPVEAVVDAILWWVDRSDTAGT